MTQVLKSVLGALMTYCVENSKQFKDNIELFESTSFKEATRRLIHKSSDGQYIIRLYLKECWGAGCIAAVPGDPCRPSSGYVLKLHDSLPRPERLHLREALQDCLNTDGVVSPICIKKWLIPRE